MSQVELGLTIAAFHLSKQSDQQLSDNDIKNFVKHSLIDFRTLIEFEIFSTSRFCVLFNVANFIRLNEGFLAWSPL